MTRFRAWMGGHQLTGFCVGLAVALTDWLLIARGVARRDGATPWIISLFGSIATMFWFAGWMVVLGALTSPIARKRRPLAMTLEAFAILPMFSFHLLSTSVRAQAGSFLTLTPIQLIAASPAVFFGRAIERDQIANLGLIVVVVAAVLSATFGWLLPRAVRWADHHMHSDTARFGCAFCTGTFIAMFLPALSAFRVANPELALIASLRAPKTLDIPLLPVERGPPLTAERAWDAKIRAPTVDGGRKRPNVALVVLESVRADHTGYMGYSRPTTPNLDRFAKDALRMRRAFSSASTTSTAVGGLLSSQWGRKHANLDLYDELEYPHSLPHDVFSALGYQTAYVSSQTESWFGVRRYLLTGTAPTYLYDADDDPGPFVGFFSDRCMPDDHTVDLALDWLKKQDQNRPWFLYLNLQRTHHPYTVPAGAPQPYQPSTPKPFDFLNYPASEVPAALNRYDNALLYVDSQFGRFASYLEDSGQVDKTLLVVVSDHAEAFGEHAAVTHGKDVHLAEIAVPLFLRWPAGIAPRDSTLPVTTLDVMPTVLDALSLPPHPSYQGHSFLDENAYRATDAGIFVGVQGLTLLDSLVCYPWKLDIRRTDGAFALYDLAKDPAEMFDLSKKEVAVTAAMRATLESQVAAQLHYYEGPERFRENPPRMLKCPMH